jgi:hypothetical protein
MRILLGISILVLVAILWTTFSIVRHVRVTRRRNRFLREQLISEQTLDLPPMLSAGNIAPLPARFAAPILPVAQHDIPEPVQAIPAPVITPRSSTHATTFAGISSTRRPSITPQNPSPSPLSLIAAARKLSRDLPHPPLAHPQADPAPKLATEEQPLRILEFVPDPATAEIYPSAPAFPSLAAANPDGKLRQLRPAIPAQPADNANDIQVRRPVRSVHLQSAVNANRPSHRPDWMYFNKDMGDLSDPLPGRIRDRIRLRSR